MIVWPRLIPPQGASATGEDPAEVLAVEDDRSMLTPAGPLRSRLRLQLVGHELVVAGSVIAAFSVQCVRCGCRFEREIAEPDFLESIEIANPDESVDLTPYLREAILLAFPSHPVCHQECKGVCRRCGADLNKGACGCPGPDDGRWAALGDLELK